LIESADIDGIRLHTQQQRALGSRGLQAQILGTHGALGIGATATPASRRRDAAKMNLTPLLAFAR